MSQEVIMKKMITVFLLIITNITFSQSSILEGYINIGLEQNLVLKQKEFSLNKSLAALDGARGLFLPSVGINARYTRAEGGRTIDFPVGDLFNPIHQTLNQLTGVDAFPTDLENQHIQFLREKEHNTSIEFIQPIFNTEIFYNYKLKSNLTEIERKEQEVYVRMLVKDIKTAYFNYMITVNLEKLANSTEEILRENLRVNKSLFKNNKVTVDVVYRSEAELSELIQNKEEALKSKIVAAAYLNFLLNRTLDENINEDDIFPIEKMVNYSLEEAEELAIKNREELMQLYYAGEAAGNVIGLSKSGYLPTLSLAANYGFQGEKYRFTDEDDYWNASLVLQWNLFRGLQDQANVEQAKWDKKTVELQKIETGNKIRLQVREAYNDLLVSLKSIEAATDRLKSSQKTFEIIDRKYLEGMSSQIEFIDARTTKTRAELNYILTKYNYRIKRAELEQVLAITL